MQSARARCTFHRNFEHFSAHIFSTIPQHNKYHRLMECIRLISIRIVGSSSPHASYGVKLPGEYDVRGIWIVNNILFSVCRPFRLGHLNLKIFASVGGIYRCAIPPRDQKIKTINERNAVSRLGQSSRLKGGAGRDNELKSIRIGEYVSKNGARYLRDDWAEPEVAPRLSWHTSRRSSRVRNRKIATVSQWYEWNGKNQIRSCVCKCVVSRMENLPKH